VTRESFGVTSTRGACAPHMKIFRLRSSRLGSCAFAGSTGAGVWCGVGGDSLLLHGGRRCTFRGTSCFSVILRDLFARLLRRDLLFTESHSAHQVRGRMRCGLSCFGARLGVYRALRLRPGSVGCPGLRLRGRRLALARFRLRSRVSIRFGLVLYH
jgi:hypothetical protein